MDVLKYGFGSCPSYGFGFYSTASKVSAKFQDNKKIILITGCNSGIGLEACTTLLEAGHSVIMACRESEKTQSVYGVLKNNFKERVFSYNLDAGDFDSIMEFCAAIRRDFKHLDVVMCNAGILGTEYRASPQNIEQTMAINTFGPALLSLELEPLLLASSDPHPRFVFVASLMGLLDGHPEEDYRTRWDATQASDATKQQYVSTYGQSKYFNIQWASWLGRKLKNEGNGRVLSIALHPGYIRTPIFREGTYSVANTVFGFLEGWVAMKNIPQGAATQVFASVCDDEKFVKNMQATPGGFLSNCQGPCQVPSHFYGENADRTAAMILERIKQYKDSR